MFFFAVRSAWSNQLLVIGDRSTTRIAAQGSIAPVSSLASSLRAAPFAPLFPCPAIRVVLLRRSSQPAFSNPNTRQTKSFWLPRSESHMQNELTTLLGPRAAKSVIDAYPARYNSLTYCANAHSVPKTERYRASLTACQRLMRCITRAWPKRAIY